ncbi:MAG: metallophosphoesterase [Lentisphaerae bacterium]|nr:metallophosphoesterase [Lentisphaerota bacterium]
MKKITRQSYILRRLHLFWRRNFAVIIALPLMLALAYYILKVEPDQLRITEYTFEHALITPELDGSVIAFVADIHASSRRRPLWQRAIKLINERPNLAAILLGGDFINGNGRGDRIEQLLDSFADFKQRNLLYSIPGNHEYRYPAGGFSKIQKAFAEKDLPLLQDQNVLIKLPNGGKINLIGLDYSSNPHRREDRRRFKNIFHKNMLNIVLCHTPEDFPFLPGNAHLTVSGHTHGGQLYLPGIGSVINPGSYGRKYSYGKIREGSKTLLVTSGLGSAYAQARFCMKPEIVFVTLKSLRKN